MMIEKRKKLSLMCKKIRKSILDTSLAAGASSSHFGGSLSTVEILVALFEEILKYKIDDPLWEDRDRFILSKGHACLGYYSILAEKGFFSKKELQLFEKNDITSKLFESLRHLTRFSFTKDMKIDH